MNISNPTTRRKLANLAMLFLVLGIWTWVLASLPRAMNAQLDHLEATAKPNVDALKERQAADEALVDPLRARNELSRHGTPDSYLAPQESQERAAQWPLEGKSYLIEVSCYTGIESKGANGRNPWSVATYRFPQGTWLDIEGFGEKRVETVTAEAYAHRIDVWFGETQEDHDRCIAFGTKMLNVVVL